MPQPARLGRRACHWPSRCTSQRRRRREGSRHPPPPSPAAAAVARRAQGCCRRSPSRMPSHTHRSRSRCPSWRWLRSPWPGRGKRGEVGSLRPSSREGRESRVRVQLASAALPAASLPSALAFLPRLFRSLSPLEVSGRPQWWRRSACEPACFPLLPRFTHGGNDGC